VKKYEWLWIIGGLIVAIVIYNLAQPTNVSVTQTVDGEPIAGQGVDPYSTSEFTVDGLAALGGIVAGA
jgi:hypothetical protein